MAYSSNYPADNLAISDIPEAIRTVIRQIIEERIVDAGLLGGFLASQYPKFSDLLNLGVNPPFVVSGSYTVPDGCTKVYISGCAGGGGGSSQFGIGGGGGESVYRKIIIGLSPGQIIPVTIGLGGTPGIGPIHAVTNNENNCGTDGGDTRFGTYLTLRGGKGAYVSTSDWIPGAAGGSGAQPGEMPSYFYVRPDSDNYIFDRQGGRGGDTMWGQGGTGGVATIAIDGGSSSIAGRNGTGYGSGGGGGGESQYDRNYAYYATAGGYGAGGILIIEAA